MKLLMARLKNYIGIYNGIGKNDITLQFENAKPIITIEGPNGSGKSTILNALNPFPDSLDKLIPSIEGAKFLNYIKGQDFYDIMIIYPVSNNGNRGTTKAYIFKNKINLNPNGNITEYKDILSNEFELDSSFLALSQLSSEDKGLADKRPAERKRFVNEMLDEMSSYNTIYKTLTKKASFMKGTINNLNDKIAKVGGQNPQAINARINSLDSTITRRENELNDLNRRIGALELILTNNKSEYTKYKDLEIDLNKLSEKLKEYPDFNLDTDIDEKIKVLTDELANANAKRNNYSSSISYKNQMSKRLVLDITESESIITNARNELMVMTGIDDSQSIESFTKDFESQKLHREKLLSHIKNTKLNPDNQKININTLDSYLIYANTLSESLISYGEIAANNYNDYEASISLFNLAIEDTVKKKNEIQNNMNNLTKPIDIIDSLEILKKYPIDCKNRKDCPYVEFYNMREIHEELYVKYQNTIKKYEYDIKLQDDKIRNLQNQIAVCKLGIKVNELISSIYNNFSISISSNNSPIGCITTIIGKLERIRPDVNLIEELRVLNSSYTASLEAYCKIVNKSEKIKHCNMIIDENTVKINHLKEELSRITSDLEITNNLYNMITNQISILSKKISDANTFIQLRKKYLEYAAEIKKFTNLIKAKTETSSELNKLRRQQYDDMNILKELKAERDLANHTYMMLQEYLEEYERYNKEYSKIETIKKFASPTTGIQTFFMLIYMNKILITANKLLALMFGGNFVLQPFVINESEFRIPCAGSGYLNDDITSMSLSQRSMIGMIINFAMMFSSSNAYNIIKLDEIDSGLDTENRLQFINVLNNVMQIMHCEQCFMVSHNLELDESLITKLHTTNI